MRVLIHISDLHFGRVRTEVVESLKNFINQTPPNLTVISGDLTQRAKHSEFKDAKQFLNSIQTPKLVVPGNHDIPLWNLWDRLFRPFKKYRQYIAEDLSPVFEDEEISVIGLNTSHSLTIAGGQFNGHHLAKTAKHWKQTSKTKILVSHHPFEMFLRKYPIKKLGYKNKLPAEVVLNLETDLLLSGHFHASDAATSTQFIETEHRSVLSIQAGTATSTRLRDSQNAFNKIFVDGPRVRIETWVWDGKKFELDKEKHFMDTDTGWINKS